MKISKGTIEQVKNNRALIESRDWLKIWGELMNPELNEAFLELGYNPLEGLTEIPRAYFLSTKIREIDIPSSITTIGKDAFSWCDSLTTLTIPNSVTSIGGGAFASCSSLTSVVIGDSVKSIGDWSFAHCTSLTSVTIGNSVKSIGYEAFHNCTSLTSLEIPDRVTRIGSWAFANCTSLTNIKYTGTKNQWGDIDKGSSWNKKIVATKVICIDGVIEL